MKQATNNNEQTHNQINYIPEIRLSLTFDKKVKQSEMKVLTSSKDTADVLREIFNKDTFNWKEEFIILCLNRRNAVVGFYKVSSGGITGTVADPKIILTVALNCAAVSIILAHNHPSGGLKPSNSDIEITAKIKTAAAYLDMKVLEHIILNDESYFSFCDEGLI